MEVCGRSQHLPIGKCIDSNPIKRDIRLVVRAKRRPISGLRLPVPQGAVELADDTRFARATLPSKDDQSARTRAQSTPTRGFVDNKTRQQTLENLEMLFANEFRF